MNTLDAFYHLLYLDTIRFRFSDFRFNYSLNVSFKMHYHENMFANCSDNLRNQDICLRFRFFRSIFRQHKAMGNEQSLNC